MKSELKGKKNWRSISNWLWSMRKEICTTVVVMHAGWGWGVEHILGVKRQEFWWVGCGENGNRKREGEREEGREGGKKRKEGRKGGREGRREGGREKEKKKERKKTGFLAWMIVWMVLILTEKRKREGKQVWNCKNSILQVLSLPLFAHPVRVVKHVGGYTSLELKWKLEN